MTTAPFPVDPALTAISIAYRNTSYIADSVLPRVPVGRAEYKYFEFPLEEGFTLPDTKVGRKGKPNEVEFTATEKTGKCDDYGLEDAVPQADIDNAPANYDPVGRGVERVTDYVLLDREVRTASLVFDAAQYPAGHKVALAGTSQWSDAASDPIANILTGLDAALIRPNLIVLGQEVWTHLRQHPDILKAIHRTSGDTGVAARQAVADLFEVERIEVGLSRQNTAKKGQAVNLARVWGKHAALLFINPRADTQGDITFGFTAEFGSRVAGSAPDRNIGLRGGTRYRAGETVEEKIVAAQAGYFIENAVS